MPDVKIMICVSGREMNGIGNKFIEANSKSWVCRLKLEAIENRFKFVASLSKLTFV